MILLATQSRTQQAVLEQSSFYTLRKQQVALIETFERDLHNAYRLDDLGLSGSDSVFDFRTTLSTNHADSIRVRYRLRRTGVSGSVPLYTLTRYERRGASYVAAGGSPPFVTDFSLQAQNSEDQSTNDLAEARQVRLSFEMMTPWRANLERVATIERVRWETTYRPLVLHDLPRL